MSTSLKVRSVRMPKITMDSSKRWGDVLYAIKLQPVERLDDIIPDSLTVGAIANCSFRMPPASRLAFNFSGVNFLASVSRSGRYCGITPTVKLSVIMSPSSPYWAWKCSLIEFKTSPHLLLGSPPASLLD
jgi:hypothetical protein